MKLIIDINEEDYKRVKSQMLDDHLPSIITRRRIIQAIETGIPFDTFNDMISNRISNCITDLNKEFDKSLRCNQCFYNDIANAGECYLCIKNIQDCFTPKREDKI